MNNDELLSNYYRINLFNGVSLAYIDCAPVNSKSQSSQGVILLIHGFPQTSYQFRNVIPTLVHAGYRILAPDYRGAGESSKPMEGFTKAIMAADMIALLDQLKIVQQVHIVGHDIGGIIAYTLASRWPERVATVCISECMLPGTGEYRAQITENPVKYFHFPFHCVANLPEALIHGRESVYIEFFVHQLCYRIGAFSPYHLQRYATAYSQPGSLRCALALFRSLEQDAEDTEEWLAQNGKCRLPCMVLNGEFSSYGELSHAMIEEVVDPADITRAVVEQSGHFIAEENPVEFCRTILAFVRRGNSPH